MPVGNFCLISKDVTTNKTPCKLARSNSTPSVVLVLFYIVFILFCVVFVKTHPHWVKHRFWIREGKLARFMWNTTMK